MRPACTIFKRHTFLFHHDIDDRRDSALNHADCCGKAGPPMPRACRRASPAAG